MRPRGDLAAFLADFRASRHLRRSGDGSCREQPMLNKITAAVPGDSADNEVAELVI